MPGPRRMRMLTLLGQSNPLAFVPDGRIRSRPLDVRGTPDKQRVPMSAYMAERLPRRRAISEIRQLLEQRRPFAHCDACLALHLGVSFSRKRGKCYTCRRTVELTSIGAGTTRLAD